MQAFKGGDYLNANNINSLSADLKLYNTLIIQVNDNDLNNPQVIGFITSNQTLKNVVVAFWGDGNNLARLNDVKAPIIWC